MSFYSDASSSSLLTDSPALHCFLHPLLPSQCNCHPLETPSSKPGSSELAWAWPGNISIFPSFLHDRRFLYNSRWRGSFPENFGDVIFLAFCVEIFSLSGSCAFVLDICLSSLVYLEIISLFL